MKFFVSVALFFLFLNCFATAQTLIRDSCKTAAAKDPTLKYDFCVQSLEQDPQSKTATSLKGLVLASTTNAESKTTNVKGIVETILKSKTYPPGTEPALRTCVELYDDANNSLNEGAGILLMRNVDSLLLSTENLHHAINIQLKNLRTFCQ